MKKKIAMFRCPNCIVDIDTKKQAGDLTEFTLEDGTIYQFDEVEIIEVTDTFKCGVCGSMVEDVVLDDTYGDTPWKLFKQNGEPVDTGNGKNFRMSLVAEYETFKEAYDAYVREHKEEGKAARINLKGADKMIVVCSFDPEGNKSYPITILKSQIKKEEENK